MADERSIKEVRDDLLAAFQTAWDDTTPVAWPNTAFDPLVDGGDEWIRVSMLHAAGSQVSLGGTGTKVFRRTGAFTVQIFTRAGAGSNRSDELAELVTGILEGATLGDVRIRDVSPNEVGQDGAWWQVNVVSTFEYDIVR